VSLFLRVVAFPKIKESKDKSIGLWGFHTDQEIYNDRHSAMVTLIKPYGQKGTIEDRLVQR
jgi:hypothetical protein